MANLKELKKKIKSTKSTLKITTAMKLVSAAKLAKAQTAIVGARPYADELEQTIKTVSALTHNYKHPFFENKEKTKRDYLVVVSSNRGLCGGYNSQLLRKVKAFLQEQKQIREMEMRFIGKKAREVLASEHEDLAATYQFKYLEPTYQEIKDVAMELAGDFQEGKVGNVWMVYNVFHSAISFTPTVRRLLPLAPSETEKKELQEKWPFDFKYEPEAAKILDTLIPDAYVNTLYTCILDARATEHGSRMSSMDSAANNCKDLIRNYTLKANRLRQAAITTELIEVVSGAESLNA